MTEQTYWNENGKYQKAYTYFFKKLVPKTGKAETPEGEMLRTISKFYYRHFNDGDTYDDLVEDGYYPITSVRGIDQKFLSKLDVYLSKSEFDDCIDTIIRYIMLKNSTPDKIWNPLTNKLVKITTKTGQDSLKMLDCKLVYTYDL